MAGNPTQSPVHEFSMDGRFSLIIKSASTREFSMGGRKGHNFDCAFVPPKYLLFLFGWFSLFCSWSCLLVSLCFFKNYVCFFVVVAAAAVVVVGAFLSLVLIMASR